MDNLLPGLRFGAETCRNIEAAARLEWLETNGLGGYASSTIIGLNTRRYHGLLISAVTPPTGRLVLLNRFDETVVLHGNKFLLGVNRFPNAIHPMGHLHLDEFRVDPFPRWIYRLAGLRLEKTFFLVHGRDAAVLRYRWVDEAARPLPPEQAPAAELRLRPFVSFRDHHHLCSRNDWFNTEFKSREGKLVIKPYENAPSLTFNHGVFDFEPSPDWYNSFEYEEEFRRGLDYREDLLTHGEFVNSDFRKPAYMMVFPGKSPDMDRGKGALSLEKIVEMLLDREVSRRTRLMRGFEKNGDTPRRLALAADQFIVERGRGRFSIIAGYPWFTDWGRDTMIALPGLTLMTRRFETAKLILETFAAYCRHGLIPNTFPDGASEPMYNSIDATLWFFVAAHEYLRATGDADFISGTLRPVFMDIVEHIRRGTIYDIRMDEDSLVTAGNSSTQLTWMDACVDGRPMTPRHGKSVEINALWYNALRIAASAAEAAGMPSERLSSLAGSVRRAFEEKFWNEPAGCLYDVLLPGWSDASVRPNQVFALSLPYPLLDGEKAHRVLETVERELLTPKGLRSLSPRDPAYRGWYGGGVESRDGAYHQGTVWGWLLGPYVRAVLNVRGATAEVRASLKPMFAAMEIHLHRAGLNTVSEIFDGDPPHDPKGCPAQAWSVAEWLVICRLLAE